MPRYVGHCLLSGPTGLDSLGLAEPRELSTPPVAGSGCGPPPRPPPLKLLNRSAIFLLPKTARMISQWNMANMCSIPASLPPRALGSCIFRGMAITSPKPSRSAVRSDADHGSGLMPIRNSIWSRSLLASGRNADRDQLGIGDRLRRNTQGSPWNRSYACSSQHSRVTPRKCYWRNLAMRTAPLTYFEESPKPLLDSVAEWALLELLELLEFFIECLIELLFGIL